MDLQLKGKSAIITGGSMGIGKAAALELAREGVNVAISARRMSFLEEAAAELQQALSGVKGAGRILPVVVDTTDMDAVNAAMAITADAFGRIDILVNGAAHPGGLVRSELDQADPQGLLQDIDIKVVGYFRCAKAVAPYMRRNRYGRIINIGGLTGRGSKQISGMRNLAIVHMTKTLSDQLGPDGITVNTMHPGVVETPHIHELYAVEAKKQGLSPDEIEANYVKATPIRRVLQPEEMGWLIAFLASPRSGCITGESLGCDGGLTRGIFL
ncbi:SDR family NAD(P)-dependent oxidoreductase [Roseateles cellulosilyticus]|uniref:SDR family oxidoreductase n=1 Tax=Pelomonas cellulosilytica TaxID=2906762 RepID=A0ABS8XW18_9BURK|nr:SDR family oxidoreductase [Pelomonas sp. P8]MCE4555001.1 SDR family oxidoreductase [Pelomonas sp. P8]